MFSVRFRPGGAGVLIGVLLFPMFAGCFGPPGPPDVAPPSRGPHPEYDIPPEVDWSYDPPNDPLDGTPYGVHLSWLEDPRFTMTVTWFTHGLDDVDPMVVWGPHPDGLENLSRAESRPVFGVEAQVHHVTILDLEPGQWFYYQVFGTTGESAIYATRTASEHGAPFRFAFFADHGVENESLNVTGLMLQHRPEFLVLAGDVAYADGDQEIWDRYFHIHEPLFARVPLMAAPGNHEFKDGFFYDAYRDRFRLPNEGLWYGFDYGNTRFTFVEFYHASAGAGHLGEQRDWFRAELREQRARKAAGEIDLHAVVQHYPFYTNHATRGHYHFNINLAEELVVQHAVDLMLVGHEHYYERSYPMAYGVPTVVGTHDYVSPTGYIQVTSGGAGRSFSPMAPRHLIEPWQATGALRFHFVEFSVDGASIEAWAWAADETGDLLDYFRLRPRTPTVPQ